MVVSAGATQRDGNQPWTDSSLGALLKIDELVRNIKHELEFCGDVFVNISDERLAIALNTSQIELVLGPTFDRSGLVQFTQASGGVGVKRRSGTRSHFKGVTGGGGGGRIGFFNSFLACCFGSCFHVSPSTICTVTSYRHSIGSYNFRLCLGSGPNLG